MIVNFKDGVHKSFLYMYVLKPLSKDLRYILSELEYLEPADKCYFHLRSIVVISRNTIYSNTGLNL